jgi:6-pyruvoyltetrahydropterin/6-carboxytetrahydropterin synthase
MIAITKTFRFAAAHRLINLDPGHKCLRVHGHNYRVTLSLEAPRVYPRSGMLVDYADLQPFGDWLTENWDHQWLGSGDLYEQPVLDAGGIGCAETGLPHLSSAAPAATAAFTGIPTAENLAAYLSTVVSPLVLGSSAAFVSGVEVCETENTSAMWVRT